MSESEIELNDDSSAKLKGIKKMGSEESVSLRCNITDYNSEWGNQLQNDGYLDEIEEEKSPE